MKPLLKETYYENGQVERKYWHLNAKPHNENGPAIICYDENGNKEAEHWYINGKRHNENGPTSIFYDKNNKIYHQEWWLNDKQYTKKEFRKYKLIKEMAGII